MTVDHLDVYLRLVSDRHRRGVIQYLRDGGGGEATLDDLAGRLRAGGPISRDGSSATGDRLTVELAHVHLPKLADHGVVEYDPGSGVVRYQGDEQIEAVLDSLPGQVSPSNP